MKNKIGIPRALSYYNNFPFYYGFFNELGYEVVVSDKTNTQLINEGCNCVVSDTCLPIKVYVGHLLNLLEKGVDTIFVPSLQSTDFKINNCSKIRGLPEIIRNVVNKPFKMIEPTLDKTENQGIKDFCFETASQLGVGVNGTNGKKLVNQAIKSGWTCYDNFIRMTLSGVPHSKAMKYAINGEVILNDEEMVKPISVAVMAHSYNLFDDKISLNLLKKLDKMDVKVYTSLNITREDALKSIEELGEFQYWANELDLTGVAAYYMLQNKIDGIISMSAFGCGPDSLMFEEIKYHANTRNIPIIHLNIDEHTGEAGFVTRLEAFVDMLERKKRKALDKKNILLQELPVSNSPAQNTTKQRNYASTQK